MGEITFILAAENLFNCKHSVRSLTSIVKKREKAFHALLIASSITSLKIQFSKAIIMKVLLLCASEYFPLAKSLNREAHTSIKRENEN
jgi:hypothetical protein